VIYRVKILGWESTNRRRYRPDAGKKALRHYEGAKAFSNHSRDSKNPRNNEDALGVWHNPVWEADGVYADLHYLKTHPMSERIVEDVRRGLGVFGASHDASGEGDYGADGLFEIHEIKGVRSVDIVTDPATVSNLWEGRTVAVTTLKKVLENYTLNSQLPLNARGFILRLCEQFGDDMDAMPMDEPAEPAAAPAADGKSLLHQAIAALAASGDPEDHKLATAVLKLVKPSEGGDGETPAPEGDMDYTDDEDKPKEGKKQPVADPHRLTEAAARSLCASVRGKVEQNLVEAITGLSLEQALKVMGTIRELTPAAPAGTTRAPRSQEAQRVTEGTTGKRLDKLPASPAALRKWARG
jgi:hypothetical protein